MLEMILKHPIATAVVVVAGAIGVSIVYLACNTPDEQKPEALRSTLEAVKGIFARNGE